MDILNKRSPGKTICPSEVLSKEDKKNKLMMDAVRQSAIELVDQGLIVITQKGLEVDPNNFRGLIRLKLKAEN